MMWMSFLLWVKKHINTWYFLDNFLCLPRYRINIGLLKTLRWLASCYISRSVFINVVLIPIQQLPSLCRSAMYRYQDLRVTRKHPVIASSHLAMPMRCRWSYARVECWFHLLLLCTNAKWVNDCVRTWRREAFNRRRCPTSLATRLCRRPSPHSCRCRGTWPWRLACCTPSPRSIPPWGSGRDTWGWSKQY